jgi:beta-glucosidase-like glycosyl hydrolase/CubicO group peptidase (beta-lactamase class C family)
VKNKTKSYWILIITAIVYVFAFVSSSANISGINNHPIQNDLRYPKVFDIDEKDKDWIESLIDTMSLHDKCAQMMMVPVYRNYMYNYSPYYKSTISYIRDEKVGGVIMFQGELQQQIEFISKAQKLSDIPLLIASDFERGLGTRIDNILEFPHAMALGASVNSAYAYEMGRAIAIESRLMGVHQNFAPVADINNNELNPVINIRSFSESRYTVSEMASSFILGSKHENVIATIKHFPGHGDTEIDSHTDLPLITGSKDQLLQMELYPFISAIESGVQSIMVGHLGVPAYDTLPSSLSKIIISDLLINTLGFDGLIVTDAMNMDAINKYYSLEEAVLLAVKAGNDIILMPPDPLGAINTIYNAVLRSEITEERINHSVRKILAAKRWVNISEVDLNDPQSNMAGIQNDDHIELAEEIARKSITILRNSDNLIPLDPDLFNNISCITVTDGDGGETATYFKNALLNRIGSIDNHLITRRSGRWKYKRVMESAENADLIIMPVFSDVQLKDEKSLVYEKQKNFIQKILNLRIPTVFISLKNPYLLTIYKNIKTYLNTYSYAHVSQDACLKAIMGEIDIAGRLPVSMPNEELHIGMGERLKKSLNTKLTYSLSNANEIESVDRLIFNAISEDKIQNAVLSIGKNDTVIYQKTFGTVSSFSKDTYLKKHQYNIGSLTEPFALSLAVMMLVDDRLLSLTDKVYYYLPGFQVNGKRGITIKNLLLHNSGIGKSLDSLNTNWSKEILADAINNIAPENIKDETVLYSELNTLILHMVINKIIGMPINEFLKERILVPLGLKNTYLPYYSVKTKEDNLIPNNKIKYGTHLTFSSVVENIMGGEIVLNNIISTAEDLSIFAQMMIQKGYYDGVQYISAPTVEEFISPQLPDSYAGLGWQTYLSAIHISNDLSVNSFGYNSNSGSALWIDPDNKMFIIFLTNSDIENTNTLIPDLQSEIITSISRR